MGVNYSITFAGYTCLLYLYHVVIKSSADYYEKWKYHCQPVTNVLGRASLLQAIRCNVLYTMAMFTLLLIYILVANVSFALRRCSQTQYRPSPWFLLIRICSTSFSPPLDKKYLQTLEECEQFAIKRKALAFNFVYPENLQNKSQMTCLVYECQELDPSLLDLSSVYDYYGIYRDLDPESNVTCVPGQGMFHLHPEAANHSEATRACEEEGAQLARVTSALQTANLSAVVATLGAQTALQRAYIGLSDMLQEGVFVTVEDEPLSCFDYRGWAPGHPRSRRASDDCVVLDSRRGWRTVDCRHRLPFLCELVEPPPDNCGVKPERKCRAGTESIRHKQRQRLQQCQNQIDFENDDVEEVFQ